MTATPELIWNDDAYARIKGGISAVDTEIETYPGDVQLFLPSWTAGKEFEATITDSQGNIEIVVVTDIDPDKFTVERGAGAREWPDGAIINQRITANLMDAMIQQERERQVAYNPNGILTAAYRGEKVFQTGLKIWWQNISGTVWQCVAGSPLLSYFDNTYWRPYDNNPMYAVWNSGNWDSVTQDSEPYEQMWLQPISTWNVGFRPSQIRVTLSVPSIYNLQINDPTQVYTIANIYPVLTNNQIVDLDFTEDVDIGLLVLSSLVTPFSVTNIVFFM